MELTESGYNTEKKLKGLIKIQLPLKYMGYSYSAIVVLFREIKLL